MSKNKINIKTMQRQKIIERQKTMWNPRPCLSSGKVKSFIQSNFHILSRNCARKLLAVLLSKNQKQQRAVAILHKWSCPDNYLAAKLNVFMYSVFYILYSIFPFDYFVISFWCLMNTQRETEVTKPIAFEWWSCDSLVVLLQLLQ